MAVLQKAIPQKERDILCGLAEKQREYAASPQNDAILKKWQALAEGRRESPTVRLLFSNFPHEVIASRMLCKSPEAFNLEWAVRAAFLRLLRTGGRHLAGLFVQVEESPQAVGFAL